MNKIWVPSIVLGLFSAVALQNTISTQGNEINVSLIIFFIIFTTSYAYIINLVYKFLKSAVEADLKDIYQRLEKLEKSQNKD